MRSAEGGVAYAQIIRREGENSCMGDKRQQMLQSIHRSVFAHSLAGKSSSAEVHNPLLAARLEGTFAPGATQLRACYHPWLAAAGTLTARDAMIYAGIKLVLLESR